MGLVILDFLLNFLVHPDLIMYAQLNATLSNPVLINSNAHGRVFHPETILQGTIGKLLLHLLLLCVSDALSCPASDSSGSLHT
jgi:hypothetical protein